MTMRRFDDLMCSALRAALDGKKVKSLPDGGHLIWGWFAELCQTRAVSPSGPVALTYQEIAAWSQVSGWPIENKHLTSLLSLDATFLDAMRTKWGVGAVRTGNGILPTDQKLTPTGFDAVFG